MRAMHEALLAAARDAWRAAAELRREREEHYERLAAPGRAGHGRQKARLAARARLDDARQIEARALAALAAARQATGRPDGTDT